MNRSLKIIVVSPASKAYAWEINILMHSLFKHGFPMENVIWLCYGHAYYAELMRSKYLCEVHLYQDENPNRAYPTGVRFNLLRQYFSEDSSRCGDGTVYLYVDSDVAFTCLPSIDDFSDVTAREWVGSDATWYAGLNYTLNAHGIDVERSILRSLEVSPASVERYRDYLPGVQWAMCIDDSSFFLSCELACDSIYSNLELLYSRDSAPIYDGIIWMTDMWAMPIVASEYGVRTRIRQDMDFSMPTDNIANWGRNLFFHNSGNTADSLLQYTNFSKEYFRNLPMVNHTFVSSRNIALSNYLELLVESGYPNHVIYTDKPSDGYRGIYQPYRYDKNGMIIDGCETFK